MYDRLGDGGDGGRDAAICGMVGICVLANGAVEDGCIPDVNGQEYTLRHIEANAGISTVSVLTMAGIQRVRPLTN